MSQETWQVQLSETHPVYQTVSLRRRSGYDNHVVMMVDLKKLIHYSDKHIHPSYVARPVSEWSEEKREGVFQLLAPPTPMEIPAEMPIASFNEMLVVREKRFLKLFSWRYESLARYVGYTNGRHRTRYLLFAGATQIPVMVHEEQASAMQRYCGVNAE